MKISDKKTETLERCFVLDEDEVYEALIKHCRKRLPPEMEGAAGSADASIYGGDMLQHIAVRFELKRVAEVDDVKEVIKPQPTSEVLARPVETLPLSVRASNCLTRAGIETIGELIELTENDVSRLKNMGKNTLRELKKTLASMGLKFAPHDDFHL